MEWEGRVEMRYKHVFVFCFHCCNLFVLLHFVIVDAIVLVVALIIIVIIVMIFVRSLY